MKRILSVLSAMLIAMSCMVACSKKNEDKKEENTNLAVKYDDVKLTDGVVATVNDEEISLDEVRFYLAQYCESVYSQNGLSQSDKATKEEFWAREEDGVTFKEDFYNTVIDGYIGLTSMVNLAKEKGIEITDEEVQTSLSQEGMNEAVEHYKTTYGISEDTIKAFLKKQMAYEKYATDHIEKDERMDISDEKVQDYFSENYIKAQHILKMTVNQETNEPKSDEEKKQVYETTKAVLDKVKADGADFKAIMLEESEDPGSTDQPDGYIFKEGDMVTEFYETSKKLKENEISDIVETSYGYHIIKRLPLDMDKDLASNKDNIVSSLKTKVFQDILSESKKNSEVKVDYTQLYKIEGILY